jgi:glycosyltransferase involved in cell wall biosynthesis
MRATISLEHRFQRTPDGAIWTNSGCDAAFWAAYLEVFSELRVLARVLDVRQPTERSARADGERVRFEPLPHYLGPRQFLATLPALRVAARHAAADDDAYILRVPSAIAGLLTPFLRKRGHPFALEVVGDPHDVFAPGAVRHPLRPLLRGWATRQLSTHCRTASAVSYVTRHALQRRYPCPGRSFAVSDIRLPVEAFIAEPRTFRGPGRRIVFVGSLEQLYKAPDVLLEAILRLHLRGVDVELTMVGDGRHRRELEEGSAARALGRRVAFLGWLPPGQSVRAELDRADLFVLPSRTEGLPRAMIEAMARGLPCIGSSVGGIPELLAAGDLVVPGDPDDLADRMEEMLRSPERLTSAASRNLQAAGFFREELLAPRRREFLEYVRDANARAVGG